MLEDSCSISPDIFRVKLTNLHNQYLKLGLCEKDLSDAVFPNKTDKHVRLGVLSVFLTLLIGVGFKYNLAGLVLGIRCIVPNNYFIWEGTRPISDCAFCSNLTRPILLRNVTREQFAPYAYSSKPIIIREAFIHWPALRKFSWKFFKELYVTVDDSYKSVDEECQFLHFKSDFISIRDVFAMSDARANNSPGEKSWYVGWGNCHPTILKEMRKFYPKPHFLPEDAEIPHKEYVFMGYDDGATMHLDFINRLMWQAQLKGTKIWNLLPPPECQKVCNPVTFHVQPGDAVLVDTRNWYHATTIPEGQFSLSIQSEYG